MSYFNYHPIFQPGETPQQCLEYLVPSDVLYQGIPEIPSMLYPRSPQNRTPSSAALSPSFSSPQCIVPTEMIQASQYATPKPSQDPVPKSLGSQRNSRRRTSRVEAASGSGFIRREGGTHECSKTDQSIRAAEQAESKMRRIPGANLFECLDCGKKTNTKEQMLAHVYKEHLRMARYACTACKFSTVWFSAAKRHTSESSEEKPVCSACGKIFSSRAAYVDSYHRNICPGQSS